MQIYFTQTVSSKATELSSIETYLLTFQYTQIAFTERTRILGQALLKVTEAWHHKVTAILRCKKYRTLEVKRGTLKVKSNKEFKAL